MRLLDVWIPRLLFYLSLVSAFVLAGMVLLAPWLYTSESSLLLTLFATDETVRRISLIAAGGLVVTAFVFFRIRPATPAAKRAEPPRTMAGA